MHSIHHQAGYEDHKQAAMVRALALRREAIADFWLGVFAAFRRVPASLRPAPRPACSPEVA